MAINNNINNTSDVFYSSVTGGDSSNNLKFSGNSIWNPLNNIVFKLRNGGITYFSDIVGGGVFELELTATNGGINIDVAPRYNGGTSQIQSEIGSNYFSIQGSNTSTNFELGNGANDLVYFHANQIVSYRYQTCFMGFNSVADLNQTGNGALVTVDEDFEVFDLNSDFASDTFSAPVDGKFFLQGAVTLKGATSANSMHLEIVTTNRTYYGAYCSPSAIKDTINNDVVLNISTYCDMEKTETAILKIIANGEGSDSLTVNGNGTYAITYFSGFLAC